MTVFFLNLYCKQAVLSYNKFWLALDIACQEKVISMTISGSGFRHILAVEMEDPALKCQIYYV